MPNIKTRTTAVALALGLSLGGAAYATAASQTSTSASPTNPNEQALTSDTAEKVKAAALAKLPGATILRVETDEGGVYEAHVRKSDGTEAEVHVDKGFAVTSVDTRPAGGPGGGPGHGGPGGRGHLDTAALAKALGQSTADVQAVLDANRPAPPAAGSVPQQRPAKPDDSTLAKALATKFGISQDKAQAALDAQHPDHP
jgi:hypothetical protein